MKVIVVYAVPVQNPYIAMYGPDALKCSCSGQLMEKALRHGLSKLWEDKYPGYCTSANGIVSPNQDLDFFQVRNQPFRVHSL